MRYLVAIEKLTEKSKTFQTFDQLCCELIRNNREFKKHDQIAHNKEMKIMYSQISYLVDSLKRDSVDSEVKDLIVDLFKEIKKIIFLNSPLVVIRFHAGEFGIKLFSLELATIRFMQLILKANSKNHSLTRRHA